MRPSVDDSSQAAASRVVAEMERRDGDRTLSSRYDFSNTGELFMLHSRERALLPLLVDHGLSDLSGLRILDVGCGRGRSLNKFIDYGARSENLVGVDIAEHRVEEAKKTYPWIEFQHLNAERIPFEDCSFDIALQFTVFSSIPTDEMRKQVAAEMMRVVRPGGFVLSYDFWINPTNKAVKGIGKRELQELFPRKSIDARRVTLAPPIVRLLAPRALPVCTFLETIPWLRTHYLALISK